MKEEKKLEVQNGKEVEKQETEERRKKPMDRRNFIRLSLITGGAAVMGFSLGFTNRSSHAAAACTCMDTAYHCYGPTNTCTLASQNSCSGDLAFFCMGANVCGGDQGPMVAYANTCENGPKNVCSVNDENICNAEGNMCGSDSLNRCVNENTCNGDGEGGATNLCIDGGTFTCEDTHTCDPSSAHTCGPALGVTHTPEPNRQQKK